MQDGAVLLAVSAPALVGGVFAVALGASIGSFLGVVIDRVPKGQPITGRSHCICGQQLRVADNIPIAGYAIRRGKARCCGARIPAWYLVLEIGTALFVVGIYALALSA